MTRHSMKQLTACVLCAIAAVVLLGAPGTADAKMIEGTVVSIDNTSILLRTPDGMQQQFDLGSGLQIPADVHAGSTVHLIVDDAAGSVVVSEIALATPASTMSPSSPAQTTTSSAQPGDSEYETTRSDLPQTASPIPAFAALGLLALLFAGGMGWQRRKAARK